MYIRTRDYLSGLLAPTSDRVAFQELPSPQVSWRSGLLSTENRDGPGPHERNAGEDAGSPFRSPLPLRGTPKAQHPGDLWGADWEAYE